MASNFDCPTTSDDDESLEEEKAVGGSFRNGEFQGRLFKWTNYLHGWQERYLILRHGFLNYYKNEFDITLGCRGALSVKQAAIQGHEFDDCRFDIRVSDSVWYLRAQNPDDRERWMQALEEHKQMCRNESGFGSETSLRRHPSLGSLTSTASTGVASTGSFRKDLSLKMKLSELETYRELLSQQVATLQTYFDACANAVTTGFEPYQKEYENANDLDLEDSLDHEPNKSSSLTSRIDRLALADHAAMAIDFKGEALTFKATTDGVIHNLTFCIELMQKREDTWKKKYEKELERRKKFQDLYSNTIKRNIPALGSPDAEEGPHMTLKEDEFYDALDQSLDRLDRELDDLTRLLTLTIKYVSAHNLQHIQLFGKDKNKNLISMKSIKKIFYIPSSFTFTSDCSSPTIERRTPQLTSTTSFPTDNNSSSDDDVYETPPSSCEDLSNISPFEQISRIQNSQSMNQSKHSSKHSKDKKATAKTSKDSTTTNSTEPDSAAANHTTAIPSVNGDIVAPKGKHRLSDDINRIVKEHLTYLREQTCDGWDLIHKEGEMKVYRREVEENGIVVDPLKIFHSITGVTGHELCHYFWGYQYRMEWETTLDSTKIIEVLDQDTVVFFQLHKRVWPAAQRDSCFWSHIRCVSNSEEDQPIWLVVNYTTPHPLAPIKSPLVRVVANVALICETIIKEPPLNPKDIKRENIECKLTYVAFVNPGGWVPSAALRSVAKREYPRFLRRFSSYVIEQTRDKPILF